MHDTKLPRGFRFAGVKCGVRPDRDRLDLALVVSDRPATAAGVFTQNRVCAAPVHLCRERLPTDDARGVVICAGNANACTGEQGLTDAHTMAAVAAQQAGCDERQMLVASTGVIGRLLPMDKITSGIEIAAEMLATTPGAFRDVTHAIMTTDTRPKVVFRSLHRAGGDVRLAGFAKGAAMIGPNLATMLAFVLTDAGVEPVDLQDALCRAAECSFNCISVEGHTSTNDTLLVLANGASERQLEGQDLDQFEVALTDVCIELARMMAGDAEGAKHLVTIEIEGLADDRLARQVAKTIADSALVKTAIFGADPNWGRFVSAAGYAGVPFEENELSLWLGDMPLYKDGAPLPFDAATASAYLKSNREVTMRLKFANGPGRCTFWTCDLTPEYVRLNAEYTT
jgi:glutamate N-acetyltransferase / amino-acid N-acetyltransferase